MEDRENCHEALLTSCGGLVSCLLFFIHTFFFSHRELQVQFISSFPSLFFFPLNKLFFFSCCYTLGIGKTNLSEAEPLL